MPMNTAPQSGNIGARRSAMRQALLGTSALQGVPAGRGSRRLMLPMAALGLFALAAPAPAADILWNGSAGSIWSNALNWTPNTVPNTGGDRAVFGAGGPTTINSNSTIIVGGMLFQAGAQSFTINLNSGMSIADNVVNSSGINQTIAIAAGQFLFMAGSAASGANVTYDVSGALELLDSSTGGNSSFINRGQINIDDPFARTITMGALSGAAGTVLRSFSSADITLAIGSLNTSTTYGGTIVREAGAGLFVLDKVGTGTLTLTGNSTVTSVTISGGTLQLGDGGTSGSLGSVAVTNNATLTVNRADTVRLDGVISGTGALIHAGSGTLFLQAANTYSGTTTINSSDLFVGNGSASALAGSLGTGAVVNNGRLFLSRSDSTTVANDISGTGSVRQVGIGGNTLTLTGNNSYTGGTVIGASRLAVGSDGALGAASGGVRLTGFNQGSTLVTTGTFTSARAFTLDTSVNGNNIAPDVGTALTLTGVIGGAGPLNKTGLGLLVLTGANTYAGGTTISAGTLQVGNAGTTGNLGAGNVVNNGALLFIRTDAVTVSNTISGTGSLSQLGTGTLTLDGNNSYSGGTTVVDGTLRLGSSTAAGTGAITTLGSVISYVDGVVIANPININSNTTQLQVLTGETATQAGVISEIGGVRPLEVIGGGRLILTAANTYTGVTTISAGRLQIGAGGATGTIGSGDIVNNAALIVNRNTGTTLSQVISGTGSVTQAGSGNLTLAGNNTYTGGTVLNAGTITVGADSGLGNAAGTLTFNGGTLATTASFVAGRTTTLNAGGGTFAPASGVTLTLTNVISGPGQLLMNGLGTLELTAANTYSGGTSISGGGRLRINADSGLGAPTGGIVMSNASLQTTASFTSAREFQLAGSSSFQPAPGTTLTLSGSVSGSALSVNGLGRVVLTGATTYDATVISSGTLQIGAGGTTGRLGTGDVANNAVLEFNRSDAFTVGNNISGTGDVVINGSSTLTATGAWTHTGFTTINAGRLNIGAGGTTGSLAGIAEVNAGATLAFQRSDASSFAGVFLGTGEVIQAGPGALTLTASSGSFGGTIRIQGGDLLLGDNAGLTGNIDIQSGRRLTTLGSASIVAPISGAGQLLLTGTGIVSLTAAATHTGGTELRDTARLSLENAGSIGGNILTGANTQVTFVQTGARTFAGNITGDGLVEFNGGPVTFNGQLAPGIIGISNALTITIGAGGSVGAREIYLNGFDAALRFTTPSDTTLSANVFGFGQVEQAGSGTLTILGDLGARLRVSAGTAQVGDGGTAGTLFSAITVDAGATLAYNRSDDLSTNQLINGDGRLVQRGTGTLTINNGTSLGQGSVVERGTMLVQGNITFNGDVRVDAGALFGFTDDATRSLANIISGAGGVVMRGTGTRTLTANQTYTGNTVIESGELRFNGTVASTAVTVQNGGTLGGSGTLAGAVTVQSGGVLSPGNSIGTITVASLTLNAGSSSLFELGAPPASDRATVTGALTVAGAHSINLANGGGMAAGTYTLMTYGSATGLPNLLIGTTPGGTIATDFSLNTATAGQVLLTYTPGDGQHWNGATITPAGSVVGGSGTWDAATTNWSNANGSASAAWAGGRAIFSAGTGTATIAGGVNASGLQFNAAYSIAGDTLSLTGATPGITVASGITATIAAPLASTTGFALTGPGTLRLTANNAATLSGDITVNSGTLAFANNALGTGALALANTTRLLAIAPVDAAGTSRAITVTGGVTLESTGAGMLLSGPLGGTGGVTIAGGSSITATGAWTHAGGTTIDAGRLNIGAGGTTGSLAGDVTINAGGTLAFQRSDATSFTSQLRGAGEVIQAGPGTLTLTASSGAFSGTLRVQGGDLVLGNNAGLTGNIDIQSGRTLSTTGTAFIYSAISGAGRLLLTNSGNVALEAVATHSGGTELRNTVRMIIGGAGGIDGNVVVANASSIQFNQVGARTLSGSITGNGQVEFTNDPVTFTGQLAPRVVGVSSNVTVTIGTGGSLGAQETYLNAATARMRFTSSADTSTASFFDGTGTLEQAGTGTLTLRNTVFAPLRISAGTVQVGDGGATGLVRGGTVVDAGATLAYNRSDNVSTRTLINGAGRLVQRGTGTLTIDAGAVMSGGAVVERGTMLLESNFGLGGDVRVDAGALFGFSGNAMVNVANAISGAGGVVMRGTGTRTLTADQTYTGNTVIESGELRFNGAVASTAVTVQNGGTLGGSGNLAGAVTVQSGGVLSPGNSIGTITVASLTLNAGSSSLFELGAPPASDRATVTGALTVAGTHSINLANGGGMAAGTYTLMTYGSATGLPNLVIGTLPGGTIGTDFLLNTATAGQVLLTYTPGNAQHWNGATIAPAGSVVGGNGTWDSTTTNWSNANGSASAAWASGRANFSAGTGTVTLAANNTATGLIFGANYTLTGQALLLTGAAPQIDVAAGITATIQSNLITGNPLTKSGDGNLVLTTDNAAITGITNVTSGRLTLQGNGRVGGAIVIDAGATLEMNRASGFIVPVPSNISGAGALVISGAGTSILTGDATHTGGTTIQTNGRLTIGAGGTTGSLSGNVTLNNSTVLTFNRSDAASFGGNITGNGAVEILDGSNVVTFTGNLAPGQGLGINGAGAARFTGTGNLTGGTAFINNANARLIFDRADDVTFSRRAMGDGRIVQAGTGQLTMTNIYTNVGGFEVQRGTLSLADGSGYSGLNAPFTRATVAAGALLAFDRTVTQGEPMEISGAGDVAHRGSGVTTLGRNQSYTGNTVISGGTLRFNGTVASPVVTVQSGGTLGGDGTLAGTVTVQSGGSIAPGNSIGTLTVGALTLNAGSVSQFELGAPVTSDRITVTGALTVAGSHNIALLNGGGLATGTYTLMTYGSATGLPNLVLSSAPSGFQLADFALDTATAGQVRVTYDPAFTLFWNGSTTTANGTVQGGAGTWAGATNFTNATGATSRVWNNVNAVFAGAAGAVTVSGTQSFQTLSFRTDGYTLSGGALTATGLGSIEVQSGITASIASDIGGTAGLAKTGAGTLVLGGANSFTGGLTVAGGTLSVAADAALGAAGGAVALNGAALATTASFNMARSITLSGDATFAPAGTSTLQLQGAVAGTGRLVMAGTGNLELASAATHSGGTLISSGTLRLRAGGSLPGDVTNNATLAFATGGAITMAGVISGSGVVAIESGGVTLSAANTHAGGTNVAGGAALILSQAAAAGSGAITLAQGATLRAGGFTLANPITFGPGPAIGVTTIDTGAATLGLTGALTGGAGFSKTGTGELSVQGGSMAGTITLAAGTLRVNGAGLPNATVNVGAGATLAGNAVLGGLNIGAGGTVAPGNSIGTVTVGGNVAFAAGSTFVVETQPGGQSDRINATGTATLGGATVRVLAGGTGYGPTTNYTILSASGGRSGTFGSVSTDLAFLTPALSYTATDVLLTLSRNTTGFSDVALTPNQRAVAGALDTLPVGAPLTAGFLPLSAPQARAGLDAISGEIHISALSGMLEESRLIRGAVLGRARQPADGGTPIAQFGGVRVSAWMQGLGATGAVGGDGNAAGLRRSMGGAIAGLDATGNNWRIGIFAGGTDSVFRVPERQSSRAHMTAAQFGAYAMWSAGPLRLTGGIAAFAGDVSTRRGGFAGISGNSTAQYSAQGVQLFGEVAYGLRAGGVLVEPFANLAWARSSAGGMAEAGSGPALLRSGTRSASLGWSTLGVRLEGSLPLAGGMVLTPRAQLGWQRAIGDTVARGALAFQGGGSAFTIAGAPLPRDALVMEAGAELRITQQLRATANYVGMVGSGRTREHALRAGISYAF